MNITVRIPYRYFVSTGVLDYITLDLDNDNYCYYILDITLMPLGNLIHRVCRKTGRLYLYRHMSWEDFYLSPIPEDIREDINEFKVYTKVSKEDRIFVRITCQEDYDRFAIVRELEL